MHHLINIPLFSGLSAKQLNTLQTQMHIHQYEKESILFFEGDESRHLHILLEGKVRLYKSSPKGTQIHMDYMQAQEIIGLFPVLEKSPFPATCEFVKDGIVGIIPMESIYVCMKDVDFSIAMVKALTKRMKMLTDMVHKETIYSTESKIADMIIHQPTMFEHFKNNEIAAILNMTPETLSRTLGKLKKKEIIMIKAHKVTVLDEERLHHILATNTIE